MSELVVRDVEVLAPGGRTLDERAAAINEEYHAAILNAANSVVHAVRCGREIFAAHAQHGSEGWGTWVAENLTMSPQRAGQLERLGATDLPAELFEPFVAADGRLRQASIARALQYVRGLPPIIDGLAHRRLSGDVRGEARRLHASGLTIRDAAELLGISYASAHRFCNPDAHARYAKKRKEDRARVRRGRAALRAAEKRAERDALRTAKPGAISDAYGFVREALGRVDLALRSANPEARRYLNTAATHLHRAEDDIVRANRET